MFNINITTSITVPGVGTVKPVVKMVYDLSSETKAMFISLGDAYKVKYLVSNDDSIPDMNGIVDFALQMRDDKEMIPYMRWFAEENLTWETQYKKLFDAIEQ